ncbi:12346_t:CDS:2 [Racocetra fulgida]|uniref:12346_t:CDS:1 n=1 Tax=Racocetra fulgida TaxID=60492 RepID=A0A9N8VQG0_9GLOM|nr:12346_t:CDS:2 [Racocetra fulgida]
MIKTEDITCPTTANIYTRINHIAEDTSSLSTITKGLTTMLIESKLDRKLDRIAEKIGEKINEDLETMANDIIGLVDEFLGDIMEQVKASTIRKICVAYVTYLCKQYNLLENNPKSVARTEKASELTFSHPYKKIFKILQINCTSPEISKDEAETSAKKHRRKKLYVQPDEHIRITQEDERYTSLVAEIPESKINKLPSWAVCKGVIRTFSSDNSSSSSGGRIVYEIGNYDITTSLKS